MNRVCVRFGFCLMVVVSLMCGFTVTAQTNPTWLGREFVKVVRTGDPIPGATGGVFNELTWFTLRDGKLHVVAGQSSTQKGLFRWQAGVLTNLVYTNTVAPTGARFHTVHFTTDETSGVVNFVGEVLFGFPGSIYGLFQLTNGNVTTVFDTANTYFGDTFSGFGYPVRVGSEIVWGSQYFTNGVQKTGIFRWNGSTLTTLVNSDVDLPGSLGNYGGSPEYSFKFDGQTVAFIGVAGIAANSPRGVYRSDLNGTLTKVVDVNDVIPGDPLNRTYFQRNRKFVTLDVDGTNTFYDTSEMVAAAGGNLNQYYGLGYRVTDGNFEVVDFGTGQFDGRTLSSMSIVDGQGDDMALMVHFTDGSRAIYVATGVVAPAAPLLVSPALTNGVFSFQFATQSAHNYRIDFKAALTDASWLPRSTNSGTGGNLFFSEPATNASGFYRVTVLD